MLQVQSINLHWASNGRAHKTNNFEICSDCADPTPVLRRGQDFKLSITFDRPFKEISDIVRVYFKCIDVEERSPRNIASLANITVSRTSAISRSKDLWSMALLSQEGNSIHLKIKSPSKIPFATYKLHVDTKHKAKPSMKKYVHHKDVYFLFNPWVKEDEVFMPESKLLDEYVLNDVGKIFVSSGKKPKGEPWVFGQFAEPVLPALKLALKDSALTFGERGNPVHMSRELSRVLCAAEAGDGDEEVENPEGVLKGKWSNYYNHSDCTDPILWNDSVSIFEEYLKSDGQPVKYGKCWVFSAIATTACRAIGIPCRSVTNFCSAQDRDLSMAVDTYIIPEDKADLGVTSENIWDFHAWNDVWMARFDLPQGYGGWQVIDSTPMKSDYEGLYMCGPASLVAIKRGEINHKYDTDYVTSAVNADVITYVYDEESDSYDNFKAISIDQDKVGKIILTKRPHVYDPNGDSDFEDITDQYKEREGTKEERLAFFNALVKSDYKTEVYNIESISFVEFKLKEIDSLDIGEDMVIHVEVKNEAIQSKTIIANVAACSLYYNGNKGNVIRNITEKIKVEPSHSDIIKIRIPAEEYATKLVELAFVKVYAICRVVEDNYTWAQEDHFVINLPEVVIATKESLKKGKEGVLLFTILNPLKRKLSDCKFIFEAPGIGKSVPVPCRDIMPEEEVTVEHRIIPDKSGEFFITTMFDSKQLKCVTGRAALIVK